MTTRYVDYGGLGSIPVPFESVSATLHGFWAEADGDRLDRLCQRVFAEPSDGDVDYRALGRHVMLTWGRIAQVIPQTRPFSDMGHVQEDQVAVWVPVASVREDDDGDLVAERFAMFVPYMWLDNPMSLVTGREVFGYAKTFGWLGFPPDGETGPFTVEAFGLRDFGHGQQAGRHPLVEVTPDDDADPSVGRTLETIYEAAREVADMLFGGDDEQIGMRFAAGVASDLVQRRLPHVFLKQFRDVADERAACLQQIVEASYRVRRFRAAPIARRHRLTVHPFASQPLEEELGLTSQPLHLAYRAELDFAVGEGRVLWQAEAG